MQQSEHFGRVPVLLPPPPPEINVGKLGRGRGSIAPGAHVTSPNIDFGGRGGESNTGTLAGTMSMSTPEKLGDGLGDHREALCARAGQKCNIKCKLVHYRKELCAEIAHF